MTQITKVGHFYMAQLGHYHVAATEIEEVLPKNRSYDTIILSIQSN